MKNSKLLTLAVCFFAVNLWAQTADLDVAAGRASLVAHDLIGAYSNFNAAVILSPTNETANALLAVTRLLVLPQQPAGSNFLNSLGFDKNGRDIFNWTSMLPKDINDEFIFPTNNTSVAIAFYRTNIIPALGASWTNLSRITSPGFTLVLNPDETPTMESVTNDYGDILLMRAELSAAEFLGYTLNAHNLNVVVSHLQDLARTNGLTIQKVLADYPSLLTQNSLADLANSKAAFTNAIALYQQASAFIRSRPPSTVRLFNLDPQDQTDEAQFRDYLTKIIQSLTVPVQFKPEDIFSLYAGAYFSGAKSLRSLLPQFSGDRYVNNTLPDYTFGGFLVNEPACDTESFLRRHPGHDYSGIYTGPVYDNNYGDPFAGNFAIFVNANQQATVVGYNSDSQNGGGIFAQFNLDEDGNFNFDSNHVFGVSGFGSFSQDGSVHGGLDFTNGDSVQLPDGQLQSRAGPFQSAAGYYTGSHTASSGGDTPAGALRSIIGSDGAVVFCDFVNGKLQGGGSGQIGPGDNFFTGQTGGAELGGVFTPSTLTLAGSFTNSPPPDSDGGKGTFTLTRSANADLPPTIITPPHNNNVAVGASATFSITASGSPPLCYQWYLNGVRIARATNSSLVVTGVSISASGNDYSVKIRNVVGEADANASLTVADTTKPTVNITNLLANQTVSNALFRVSGTAKDNAGVSSVWYQLNNGAWTFASSTNGWTNWWADVTLTAGTNTIRTYAMDINGHGYIYVADYANQLIRRVNPAGVVTTLAGDTINLSSGFADGTGNAALFDYPAGVSVDVSGNVYVSDSENNLVRKVTPAGMVTTLAGDTNSLSPGYADGIGKTALFSGPSGGAVDVSGNVYVADTGNNLIRKITPAGVVTTLAGNTNNLPVRYADGIGKAALFNGPIDLAVDIAGNVYVADTGNNLIRKISPAGVVTTLAGDTNNLSSGYADGPGSAALFKNPFDLTVDVSGNVYVADTGNNLIRKISPAGMVTTLAGDTNNLSSGYADGAGNAALFNDPVSVTVDFSNNVYVADTGNNLIRKISPAGMVTTLAGDTNNLSAGYAEGLGSAALFNSPVDVAADNSGANISATNTLNFVYVVSATLMVHTNGNGTVNPNYNGALLQIGQNYSMAATAAAGFGFTNWTDVNSVVLTNGAPLKFLMASNLTFTANFLDVQKPTLSITNVTAGMSVSNSAFTVKGKAADNVAVSNVFYSLNNAGWSNAAMGNKWTNWSAAVTLLPGTNTMAAYAVDGRGNVSITNTLKFVYVVSATLTVSTNGLGSLTPNYNGALLQIGKSYAITATPGAGFGFINWTGGTNLPLNVLTNGTTVQFLMMSNLMLQASFADITKPTLAITAPTAGQRWSNSLFTVKGTASDNGGVSSVFYLLNSGSWTNATGTTNWSAAVNLVPGTNHLSAYAADFTGNKSVTNSVNLDFVVTNQLEVIATGLGTISPNYSNAWLELGRNYSITATPAIGFICTNWVVSTNWMGGATTNNAVVRFMMQSNLTLQVNFADVSKPTLTITAPAAGQHMTNALASVKGTASDNWKVSNVWYQFNNSGWTAANTTNAWTNWGMTLPLVSGTNTVKAFAMDLGGNFSVTNNVSFVSSNTFKLQLAFTAQPLTGNGLNFAVQISPGINGRIQASTNLINWQTLTNFTGTNVTINLNDAAATNFNQRFYRAVTP